MTKQNRIVMAAHRRYFGYNVRTKTYKQPCPIYIPSDSLEKASLKAKSLTGVKNVNVK